MSAAATRAWYLPTCVNCATPVTSPIAHTSSVPVARSRSSTSTPRDDVLTPSSSRPSRSTFGRRPAATSRRSASSVEPSDRWSRMAGSTRSIPTPRRTSIPSSRKNPAISSPASGWTRPSRWSPRSTIVTWEPMREKNCASSAPTGPPPITTRLRGTLCVRVASRFVQYSTESSPSMGGIAGREPVARTRRAYGSSCPSTSTTPGRTTPPCPPPVAPPRPHAGPLAPREPAPPLLEVVELAGVVPVAGHPVAPRPDALGVRTFAVQPRRPLEGGAELGRPQHRLRRHTREVRALAADEPALDKRDLRLVVEPAEGADEMLAGRPSAEDDDFHLLEPVRREELVRDLLRRLLVHDICLVHRLHRRQCQLRRDRVHGTGEKRPVRSREQALLQHRRDVLEAEDVLVVDQRRVLLRLELLRVGREAVSSGRLALVEQRVDADAPDRDELDVVEPVDLLHPENAGDPSVALRIARIRERLELLQVAHRLEAVLRRRRGKRRERVRIRERRRVECRQAARAGLLELLRRDVGRVRRFRRVLQLGQVKRDDAGVLGIEVHLPARDRLVGELP